MSVAISVNVAEVHSSVSFMMGLGALYIVLIPILLLLTIRWRRDVRKLELLFIAELVITGLMNAYVSSLHFKALSFTTLAALNQDEWLSNIAATYGYWGAMVGVATNIMWGVVMVTILAALFAYIRERRRVMRTLRGGIKA